MGKDFIEDFLEYTDSLPSPRSFRLWSAISAVGGVLERRIFTRLGPMRVYPNLFVMLVGGPGTGKSLAISVSESLWRSVRDLYIAPNNMTKAALVDALSRAERAVPTPDKDLLEYHSMIIAADEISVLIPIYDASFLGTISRIYDNVPSHEEERRHGEHKNVTILNPQLSLLVGAQPDMLSTILPEEAWGQGFVSRFNMIYSDEAIEVPLFGEFKEINDPDDPPFRALVRKLEGFTRLQGQYMFTAESQKQLQAWVSSGMEPRPDHARLVHYNIRRKAHLGKLAMISSVSARADGQITPWDIDRAKGWLLESEATMPSIFRAMVKGSDWNLLGELYYFMYGKWAPTKRPIPKPEVERFLAERVTIDKIGRVIEIAESSEILSRVAGSSNYIPNKRPEKAI